MLSFETLRLKVTYGISQLYLITFLQYTRYTFLQRISSFFNATSNLGYLKNGVMAP